MSFHKTPAFLFFCIILDLSPNYKPVAHISPVHIVCLGGMVMEYDAQFTFIGGDRRMRWAMEELWAAGYNVLPWPTTEAQYLVLPLPAFHGESINGGPAVAELLPFAKPGMTILGGMMSPHRTLLASTGARILDYQQDETFTAANGEITAEGAVSLATSRLPVTLPGQAVLVCGWGRIGQLLARKLQALGAKVTVCARKARDLGLIRAMGYGAMVTGDTQGLGQFRAIFNTIPAPVYSAAELMQTGEDCLLVELASVPGLENSALRPVISASGLPGSYAPETAGRLIGRTILRLVETERG